jgi:hypothetical protein
MIPLPSGLTVLRSIFARAAFIARTLVTFLNAGAGERQPDNVGE